MLKGCRHDLAALIDRQIERSKLEAKQEGSLPEAHPELPYVAISRAAGVDALAVARAIAGRLDFALVDQELVDEIGREAGVPLDVVRTYDLNPHPQLEQMIADLPFMKLFSEDEYVHRLSRVVRWFAAQGRVVLLGHAASLVLHPGAGVRVHVTAPADVRARWCAITDGVDLEEARRRVDAEDERRRVFCERHFGHAQDSPNATDLILDVTAQGEGAIADRIAQALSERLAMRVGPERLALRDVLHGREHVPRGFSRPHLL